MNAFRLKLFVGNGNHEAHATHGLHKGADFDVTPTVWNRTRTCLICLTAVLIGCQSPAPNLGPIYKLRPHDVPVPTTPVAVSVTDKRPDTEKSFKPGSVDLLDYENAIDVLTLDNFEPGPIPLLEKSLAGHLSQLETPPTWAEVDLTRFRVVVNRSDITAAEYERQKRMSDSERMIEQRRLEREYHRELAEHKQEAKAAKAAGRQPPPPPCPPPPYIPPSSAPGVGVGVGLATSRGGGAGGIVGGIAAGLIAAAIVSDLEDQRPSICRVGGTDTPSGVTCQIEMHVRLHWPDGRREEFDINSEAHTPPPGRTAVDPQNPLMALQLSVIPTVQLALEQASIKLKDKGAAYLAK